MYFLRSESMRICIQNSKFIKKKTDVKFHIINYVLPGWLIKYLPECHLQWQMARHIVHTQTHTNSNEMQILNQIGWYNPWVHCPWTYRQPPDDIKRNTNWDRIVSSPPCTPSSPYTNIFHSRLNKVSKSQRNCIEERRWLQSRCTFCAKLLLSFANKTFAYTRLRIHRLFRRAVSEKAMTEKQNVCNQIKYRRTRASPLCWWFTLAEHFSMKQKPKRKKNKSAFSIVLATPLTMNLLFFVVVVRSLH